MRKFKLPYKPRLASRKDYSHHKTFGVAPVVPLPDELLKRPPQILNQGDTPSCTAAASCTARSIMTGRIYDPVGQWQLELNYQGVKDSDGFTLDVPAKVGKDKGFIPIFMGAPTGNRTEPIDKTGGYFFKNSKNPGQDWFDTLCYTQYQLFQQTGKVIPFQFGINWYKNWEDLPPTGSSQKGFVPMEQVGLLGGHDTTAMGFTNKFPDGIRRIGNPNTWGEGYGDHGVFWFDREATNKNIGKLGVFYWLDTEDMPETIVKLGIIAAILQNIKTIFQILVNAKNTNGTYPPSQPAVSRITDWANAVKEQEGWFPPSTIHPNGSVSFQHSNPGNLKFSTLTKSWGATQGIGATDGGKFCQFANYDQGFNALCNFLKLGAEDELLKFHQARTLRLFTRVYANPPSDAYARHVADALKVDLDYPISKLL